MKLFRRKQKEVSPDELEVVKKKNRNKKLIKIGMFGCGAVCICSAMALGCMMLIAALAKPDSEFAKAMIKIPVVSDIIFTDEKKALIAINTFWDEAEKPEAREKFFEEAEGHAIVTVDYRYEDDSNYDSLSDFTLTADVQKSGEDYDVNLIFDGTLDTHEGFMDMDYRRVDGDEYVRINDYEGDEDFMSVLTGTENMKDYEAFEEGLEDVLGNWYDASELTTGSIVGYLDYAGVYAPETAPENMEDIVTLMVKLMRYSYGPYDGTYESTFDLLEGKAYVFDYGQFDLMKDLFFELIKASDPEDESMNRSSAEIDAKFGVDKTGAPRYLLFGLDATLVDASPYSRDEDTTTDFYFNMEIVVQEKDEQKIREPNDVQDTDDLNELLENLESDYRWDSDTEEGREGGGEDGSDGDWSVPEEAPAVPEDYEMQEL